MIKSFKGLSEYFQENNAIDQDLETKIIETIKTEINKIDRTTFIAKARLWFWIAFGFLGLTIVLGIVFILVHLALISSILLIASVGMTIGSFIYYGRIKVQYERLVRSAVDQRLIYKTYFENKYSNFEVKDPAWISASLAKAYRGSGIPNDADIFKTIPGFTFKIDKIEVTMSVVEWVWTRRINRSTQSYYRRVVYLHSQDHDPRWESFEVSLSPSVGWFHKAEDLENESFNKLFNYKTNDQVRLRVLLTPFVQESFANNIINVPGNKSWSFHYDKNYWLTDKVTNSTIFEVNRIKLDKDIDIIAQNIFNDLRDDLKYVEMQLAIVWTMRELVKIR